METSHDFAERLKAVIEQEAQWHKNNPDPNLTQDYMAGFLNGLQHAAILLEKTKETKSE